MTKFFSRLFVLVIGVYLGKYLFSSNPYVLIDNTNSHSKITELLRYLEYNYVDEIDLDSLQEEVISRTLESLDPHSSYIPISELQEVTESMQGNFEGIGVEFQIIKDTILVVSPISGGPSERQGILAGDKIVRVDTLNVAGVGFTNKDVLKTLKGKKGTEVLLFIKRKNIDRLLEFNIVRDRIPITSVDVSYMVRSEVGYIKVNRFSGTTDQEFISALSQLKKSGMKKLILDLRSNPGGYLSAAINMADEFLPSGRLIVYTEGNARSKRVYESTYQGQFQKESLVVLIDEGSASASEIVAGAIQDHDRGFIVGRRSFGKGLVQEQNQMSDGSAFRLTTARYFTPSGRSIQKPYSDDAEEYNQEASERYDRGELYYEDSVKVSDSLKYFTEKGRVVYGGGGIYPDYFIPMDSTGRSDWLFDLLAENIINTYAFDFVESQTSKLGMYKTPYEFQNDFLIEESQFLDFVKAAKEKGVEGSKSDIESSRAWVKRRIKALIARQLWSDEGFYRAINADDVMMNKALELLSGQNSDVLKN
jgi:carboxyl-terminal processing protease